MAKMRFKAPYSLSLEEIKKKVEEGARKFGGNVEWKNENECHFSGEYKGFSGSGVFTVNEKEVDVLLNLPLAAKPFQGKIKEKVIEELNKPSDNS